MAVVLSGHRDLGQREKAADIRQRAVQRSRSRLPPFHQYSHGLMGTLRKYLMNGAIISAVLSGVSAVRHQRKAPADWRTVLTWVSWGLTLAVALGTVRINSLEADDPAAAKRDKPAKGPKPAKDKR